MYFSSTFKIDKTSRPGRPGMKIPPEINGRCVVKFNQSNLLHAFVGAGTSAIVPRGRNVTSSVLPVFINFLIFFSPPFYSLLFPFLIHLKLKIYSSGIHPQPRKLRQKIVLCIKNSNVYLNNNTHIIITLLCYPLFNRFFKKR